MHISITKLVNNLIITKLALRNFYIIIPDIVSDTDNV